MKKHPARQSARGPSPGRPRATEGREQPGAPRKSGPRPPRTDARDSENAASPERAREPKRRRPQRNIQRALKLGFRKPRGAGSAAQPNSAHGAAAKPVARPKKPKASKNDGGPKQESAPRKHPDAEPGSHLQRLQKIISLAGITSRRKAEELITAGRVTVNGAVITELGSKADLQRDHIKVDGRLLGAPKHHIYIALNKPRGCVTTVSDPEGRQTVMHLMRGVKERVFPVGRLDYNSEGLLLLTNDGEFAHAVTAPASNVVKTYVAKIKGTLTDEQEQQFRDGIPMHGHRTAPAQIRRIKHGENPWYEILIHEGRQNQIHVMFKHFGLLVEKLRRLKIGFLELDVAPGRFRHLTPHEVERFRRFLKLDAKRES